ncbi:copper-binding protein [Hoeflea sp.]|uniref:copper-binding protein n=1 Tax=Hoeflea sp. TaxID=1940281 RepID=UPI003B52F689
MKIIINAALAFLMLIVAATTTLADEYTKGKIKKIDAKAKKVTIIHEELKNLDMPAMTMVFRTADDGMLDTIEEGQDIEFIADRVNGKLTVIEIKK